MRCLHLLEYSSRRTRKKSKRRLRKLGHVPVEDKKEGRDQAFVGHCLCPGLCSQGSQPVRPLTTEGYRTAGETEDSGVRAGCPEHPSMRDQKQCSGGSSACCGSAEISRENSLDLLASPAGKGQGVRVQGRYSCALLQGQRWLTGQVSEAVERGTQASRRAASRSYFLEGSVPTLFILTSEGRAQSPGRRQFNSVPPLASSLQRPGLFL